jgi:hypothetical protein
MSQRMGRKPLSTEHLRRVQGSPHAKERMRVFLETLGGKITVDEACQQIGIGDSQFHQVRHRWLQEAVELLEPRQSGRPPHEFDEAYAKGELLRLEAEVARLRQQLMEAQTREEVARILDDAPKKTAAAPTQPR